MIPPIGRAMKPTANVLKEASSAMTGGIPAGKNAVGKTSAAADAYRKKSYHSMLVPASAVRAILRTERSSRRAGAGPLSRVVIGQSPLGRGPGSHDT